MTDYSKIENQVGCGYCLHELGCEINKYWKRIPKYTVLLDRYANRPALWCGKFKHHSEG